MPVKAKPNSSMEWDGAFLSDVAEIESPSADSGRVPSFHYEGIATFVPPPLAASPLYCDTPPPFAHSSLGRLPAGIARSSLTA